MPSLVVFDLDGTLIDSTEDLVDSTNELLACYGAAPLALDQIGAMVGDGAARLVSRALRAAGVTADLGEVLTTFLEIYDRRLVVHTRPYEGIAMLVEAAAARAPLAVLTNKPEAPTRRLLDAFGLTTHFRWVIGGDSSFPRKPDPAPLLELGRRADATRERTLMVGDSIVDLETARRAGTRVCAALYGMGHFRGPLELEPGEGGAATVADLDRYVRGFLAAAP